MLRIFLSLLIGFLFLLPHFVRMGTLHSIRDYSPFSVRSSSPTTIDETFLYAAEVNYTYRQHHLANDTDAFEHRNQPMPYSLLPTEAEVGLAKLVHGIAVAQIVCYFLFPSITAWLLIGLFCQMDASVLLAGFLALLVLVASFSPRTVEIGTVSLILHGLHSGFIETLQASRNPNPNMTFPLFLGALLTLVAALRQRSSRYALLAGILGGLLFYSYIYYGIAWAAGVALLAMFEWLRDRGSRIPALVALLVTSGMAVPFLLWVHAAKKAGGYVYRENRLGMVHSHIPAPHDLKLSAIFAACLLLLWTIWRYFSSGSRSSGLRKHSSSGIVVLVFGCAAAGGILGMNMQVITGFNAQAGHHFPHMIIQPVLVLLCLAIALMATANIRKNYSVFWAAVPFLVLFAICATTQVEAAVNSAPLHRIDPAKRALFHWLNRNTHPGDVVATTSLALAVDMPVLSQDCTLMVDGSRTLASDSEILDRYLLAEALTGAPASIIADELESRVPVPANRPFSNYPAFFFEHSPYLASPHTLTSGSLDKVLADYRTLNPALELSRFRVNYLYMEKGHSPAKIAGVQWQRVLTTSEGSLWRLNRERE